MAYELPTLSPVRALAGIVTATATAVAVVLAVALTVTVVTEETVELWVVGILALALTPMGLLYFSVAVLAVRKAARPRSALAVGAVLTGTIVGLWSGVGSMGHMGTALEMWAFVLLVPLVLSVSLWLGSEALLRVCSTRISWSWNASASPPAH